MDREPCVGPHWTYSQDNIITGVPDNDWTVKLSNGQCVDIIPIGDNGYAVRPYGYNDKFRGNIAQAATLYIGQPFSAWASERGIDINVIKGNKDLQSAAIFPLVENVNDIEPVLRWMLTNPVLRKVRRYGKHHVRLVPTR